MTTYVSIDESPLRNSNTPILPSSSTADQEVRIETQQQIISDQLLALQFQREEERLQEHQHEYEQMHNGLLRHNPPPPLSAPARRPPRLFEQRNMRGVRDESTNCEKYFLFYALLAWCVCEVSTTSVILGLYWNDECDKPLQIWLVVLCCRLPFLLLSVWKETVRPAYDPSLNQPKKHL